MFNSLHTGCPRRVDVNSGFGLLIKPLRQRSISKMLKSGLELVALLCLSSWYLVIVVWLFLMISLVCLQFVIMVFPDQTHLLYGL